MSISKTNWGYIALLITAAFYGASFIFQRHATQQHAATLWFITWQYVLGAILLSLFTRNWSKKAFFYGIIGGGIIFFAMFFQQWGIAHTTAGKSGVITGLYVVFVPLMEPLFFKNRIHPRTWLAVALTLAGLIAFSGVQGSDITRLNIGDGATLICAFFWALNVLWTGFAVKRVNIFPFTAAQLITVAVVAGSSLWIQGGTAALTDAQSFHNAGWDVLITGITAIGLGFLLQAAGQRTVPPAHTTIILSSEAIVALALGWIFLNEHLSLLSIIGSALLFSAMILAHAEKAHH